MLFETTVSSDSTHPCCNVIKSKQILYRAIPLCYGLLLLLRARLLKLRKHLSLEAYCVYPKLSSAQIQYPCLSYKETEVPE
jgi:hypothetical protein